MLEKLKKRVWHSMPGSIKLVLRIMVTSVKPYRKGDNSAYWRGRARSSGQQAVLWTNDEYNMLYRQCQKNILRPYVEGLGKDARILDVGCGIGVVSEMIVSIREDVCVDAVDFKEMIEVARKRVQDRSNINLIESSAEQYFTEEKYDLVVSSGCYSAIRDLDKMYAAISNGAEMVRPGGVLLMIDPFHKWKYLARARVSSGQVEKFVAQKGFSVIERSGVLFWPYRDILANSAIKGVELVRKFERGERLLSMFGKHRFADYKILAFRKV